MKKIFFLAASALMFAACNEDFKDWAEPQSAEAGSTLDAVALSVNAAKSIDLDEQTAETLVLFTPSLNGGATAEAYNVKLTAGENSYNLSATAAGAVSVAELNKAVIALYNRERLMRDINMEVSSYATVSTSAGKMTVPVSAAAATQVMVQSTHYAEFFYEIGGETGWSEVHALWGQNFDGKYVGYAYLDSDFKFKPNADDWNDDLECQGDGKLGEGGNNCPAPEKAGLHRIDLDLEAMTYKITYYGSVSIIGAATGDSSWSTDIDMEYSSADKCYVVTTELVAGDFKFRSDHNWNGVNWGGDPNHLKMDADNCTLAKDGLYIVRFWPSYSGNGRYTIEEL